MSSSVSVVHQILGAFHGVLSSRKGVHAKLLHPIPSFPVPVVYLFFLADHTKRVSNTRGPTVSLLDRYKVSQHLSCEL